MAAPMASRLGRTLAAGVRTLKERASSSADNAMVSPVPYVVETVILHLERKELELEGIFRVSGSLSEVKALKADLDRRRNVDLTKVHNPHTISGVLKLWLRELPKPPLTFELYDAWRVAGLIDSKRQLALQTACLKECFRTLPALNQVILTRLFMLLHEVSKRSEINKMPASNLAIVFAPTILRPEIESVETMLGDAEPTSRVVEAFIAQAPTMLDGVQPTPADLASAPTAFTEALGRARLKLEAAAPTRSISIANLKAPAAAAGSSAQPSSPRAVQLLTPMEHAALLVQSVWRGHRIRKRIANLPGGRAFASACAQACARIRSRHFVLVSCIAELKSYAAIMRSSLSIAPTSSSPLAAAAAARAASAPGQGPVNVNEPLAVCVPPFFATHLIGTQNEAEVKVIFNGIDLLNDAHLAIQGRINKLTNALPWEMREPGLVLEECAVKLEAWDEYRAGFAAAKRSLMFVIHSRVQAKRWMETMQGRGVSGLHLADLLHEPVRQLAEHARLVAGLRDALIRNPQRQFSIDTYRAARAAALWQRVAQSASTIDNSEAEQELLMVEKTIVGAKDAGFIMRPSRRLVRKGELKIASEKRFVFLFNDLCLVTKQEGLSYHFKYVVELVGASVRSCPPGKYADVSLELATPDRPFLMVLRNADECKAWAKDLENVTAHIAARLIGVPLPDLLSRDRRPTSAVPRAFELLLEQLTPPAPSLFCLVPPAADVTALRECLERGGESDLVRRAKEAGPGGQHQVAALLCSLLEALPQPLLPSPAPSADLASLTAFVKGLSSPHHALLRALIQITSRIAMPPLDVPSFRLLSLSLLPSLSSQMRSSVQSALDLDSGELALAVLIENPSLLTSSSPPPVLALASVGTPNSWSAARLAGRNKPLPRAPSAPVNPNSPLPSPTVARPPMPSSIPVSLSTSPPPVPPLSPPRGTARGSADALSNSQVTAANNPLPLPPRPSSPSLPTVPLTVPLTASSSGPSGSSSSTNNGGPPPASPSGSAPTTRRNVRPLPNPIASPTSPTREGRRGGAPSPPGSGPGSVQGESPDGRKKERGAPVIGSPSQFVPEAK